jgi:serine/threonine protein kinase
MAPGALTRLLSDLAAAPPLDVYPTPHVGLRLGRFLLVREIGRGGFGTVFEAEDVELRRRVALKIVRPISPQKETGSPAEWLRQEAEAAAQLRHPNVVTLYDAGAWEGGTYLVYELLRGETLAKRLAAGPIPRAEARRVLRDLARALAHIHAAGVVHRDVTAANIFLDRDGSVKLLDLGLAQVVGTAGHPSGTPPYASPEQWRGDRTDARADVYAWGVLAHQLLSGQLPDGPATTPPPRPSQPPNGKSRSRRLGGSLRSLVTAARSAHPERRPEDGQALSAALDKIERRRAAAGTLRVAAMALAVVAVALVMARPSEQDVARTASTSMEAYREYSKGRRCIDRPSEGASWMRLDCADHFRDALRIDPNFALAHFELAALARWDSHPTVSIDAALEPALRHIDRLPPREQAILRAWKAELDGDSERADEILAVLAEQYPQDAHVALAQGESFYRQARHAEAIAPLTRAVKLDPTLELAADELVWSLGLVGRTDELRKLADKMAATAPSAGTYHAEIQARGWTGDLDRALRVARLAAVGDGGAAREDLEDVLVAAGDWDEAEGMLRADVARGAERAPMRLESFLLLRGRFAEARALTALQPTPTDPRERFIAGSRRAHRLVANRDVEGVERVIAETRAWSREAAASLAPLLAYVGGLDAAESLLRDVVLEPGTPELTRALVAWRRSGPASALPVLRRFARADPTSVPSIAPEARAWLAAECAMEAEGGEAALADLRLFQRFYYPLGLWRAWSYPRSLVMEARLLADLGRHDEAADALDRLDALWARADPGLPLLREARLVRKRIDASSSTAAPAARERGP